ncbi:diguanylate cyclase [Thiohalobacter thiocyanaticus]|uniref:diguanylate cyclase n=1 Tax=Thiohalobacter thiocyanaticus TaxID=585455 RepID=A0A426QK73_9GAMM|nr:response regulator [Thiohalobacter thiocyanaticus]RRQ22148.1 diguanylate cyclase [Thiohalobacter thiocyanaticus]
MFRKLTRILVIDGSEVTRTIISRILDEEMPQAQLTLCGSGSEARDRLEEQQYDLITTALLLPDMDGLDFCRQVRAHATHHHTPVVVVSGDANERLLQEGFAAGVTDYFDKSLGYQAFVEFIKEFTQRNPGLVGRVLYVEDSPTTARHTLKLLEHHGLQVVHTTTAEEAIELLQRTAPGGPEADAGFDIVMTDFFLKGAMTGGDLLHAIRSKFRFTQQEMPVLVLTTAESPERQVEVFHAGANDFVQKPIVEEILLARIRSLLLIKQQFTALKVQAEEMRLLATTDSLTGVRNKCYLLHQGEQFMEDRRNQPVAALLLDIDHFKRLNDSHGHLTGDQVLEQVGRLLNESVREGTLVARFGGEEFAILLPRCRLADAQARAEELRAGIEALRPVGQVITVSVGVASTETCPEADLTALLDLADRALYAAKDSGRNRVCA